MIDSDKILNALLIRLWSYLLKLSKDLADANEVQAETIKHIYDELTEIVSSAYVIEDGEI